MEDVQTQYVLRTYARSLRPHSSASLGYQPDLHSHTSGIQQSAGAQVRRGSWQEAEQFEKKRKKEKKNWPESSHTVGVAQTQSLSPALLSSKWPAIPCGSYSAAHILTYARYSARERVYLATGWLPGKRRDVRQKRPPPPVAQRVRLLLPRPGTLGQIKKLRSRETCYTI